MNLSRRSFIKSTSFASGLSLFAINQKSSAQNHVSDKDLLNASQAPVLKSELFSSPVTIESVDLLRKNGQYIVRVRSKDGAEGYAVSNNDRIKFLYPIFVQRVAPYFINKDARQLDELIDGVFIYKSNYKLQGLAFWVCVASAEIAILDLLGQLASQPLGNLFGEVRRADIEVYRASGNRGNTPEEEVNVLQRLVKQTGANAIKFKVGGRMSNDADSLPGRPHKLIPLARKTLGDEMNIFVDSNGSYGVEKSIEIGRICEANNIGFFEEPCPFDHLWETKQIADALDVPIAGGEQESSLRRFRWMIKENAVQIVQPDLFYFGGYVRTLRVARMAQAAGMKCIPHMGGSTLGYLYVLHFASFVPNAGRFMEYKGKNDKVPYECKTSSLDCINGKIRIPSGSGIGIEIDPDFINSMENVAG